MIRGPEIKWPGGAQTPPAVTHGGCISMSSADPTAALRSRAGGSILDHAGEVS